MQTDRPSVAERYATATEAHSLRVSATRAGPADVLIASGMTGKGLGASLMRLRAEFDTIRGLVRGTANNSLTERALILMQMRTLPEVRRKLGDLAQSQALKTRFMGTHRDLMLLTGRVLDVYLDPLCHHCDGRGSTGGGRHEQTGPPVLCKPCGGSGARRGALGRNQDERAFAGHFLALLERSASHAETLMARKLR